MKGLLFVCFLLLGALASANKLAELVQKVKDSETEVAETSDEVSEEVASLLQVGEGKYIPPANLDPKFSLKPTIIGKGTVIDRPFKPKKVSRAQLAALKQQDRLSFERAKWVTRRMKKIIGDDSKMRKDKNNKGKAHIKPADQYVEADVIGFTPKRPAPKKAASKFVIPELAKAAFQKEVKAGSKRQAGKFSLKPKKWNKPKYDVKGKNQKPTAKPSKIKAPSSPSWNAALQAAVKKVSDIAKTKAPKRIAKKVAPKAQPIKAKPAAPKKPVAGAKTAKKPKVARKVPFAKRIARALAGRKAPRVDWKSPSMAKKLVQVLNKLAMQDANEDVIANEQAQLLHLAASKSAEAAAFGPALLNGQAVQNQKVMEKLNKFERALRFMVEKIATDDILSKAATKREAAMNNKIDRIIKAVRYLVAKTAGLNGKRVISRAAASLTPAPRSNGKVAVVKQVRTTPTKIVPKKPAAPAAKAAPKLTPKPQRGNKHPNRKVPRRMRFAETETEEEEALLNGGSLDAAVNAEMMRFMKDAEEAEADAMAAEDEAAEEDAAEEEEEESAEDSDAAEDTEEETEEAAEEEEEEEEVSEEEEESAEEEEEGEADEESFLEVSEEEEEESEEEEEESAEEEEEEESAEEEEEEAEEEEEEEGSFLEVSEEEEEEEEGPQMFYPRIEENEEVEEGDVVGGPQRSEEEAEAEKDDEETIIKLAEKNAEGAFIESAADTEEEEAEEEEEQEDAEEEEFAEEEEEEQVDEEEEQEEEAVEQEEEDVEENEEDSSITAETGNSFIDNNQQVKDLRSAIESIQAELSRVKKEGASLRA